MRGPLPLPGRSHHSGADRIAFHIAHRRQQMLVLFHPKAFEPPLPDMTAGSIMAMTATPMTGHPPLHPPAQDLTPGRLEQQVKRIRHQATGQHLHGVPFLSLAHQRNKRRKILRLMKDRSPPIAPIKAMVTSPSTIARPTLGIILQGLATFCSSKVACPAPSSSQSFIKSCLSLARGVVGFCLFFFFFLTSSRHPVPISIAESNSKPLFPHQSIFLKNMDRSPIA